MSGLARWTAWDGLAVMAIPLVLQITMVVGLAWVLDRLLAKRPAAARHAVWLCALMMILIGPAVVLIVGRAGISLVTIRWETAGAAVGGGVGNDPRAAAEPRPPAPPVLAEHPTMRIKPTATPVPTPIAARSAESRPDISASQPPLRRVEAPPVVPPAPDVSPKRIRPPTAPAIPIRHAIAGTVLAVWLLGVLVLAARLIRGMVLLGSLRRSARPIEAGELGRVLDQVRAALGIPELPPIVTSPRVSGPVATGVLRPMVILPEGLLRSIGDDALRDILLHECAHIVRRDPLIGVIQRLVELFYWPHPLVHLLNRRLSRAREEVCDDIVLCQGDAIAYAGTLLAMAERFESVRRPREALALMNPRWKLEDRVAGLLDPRRRPIARADRRGLIAVSLALFMTTVAVAGVRWGPSPPAAVAAGGEPPARSQPASGQLTWSIPGLVVDEAGKPVAGAAVRVLRAAEVPEAAISGPDGAFVIRAVGPMMDRAELIASADDGRRTGLGTFRESIDSTVPSAPARIVLQPSRTVVVTVVGREGKPVPEAGVEVIARFGTVGSAKADATGRATLQYPASASVFWVTALKAGAGLDYYENYRSWPVVGDSPSLPETVSLVLEGALASRVKVIGANSKPVSGVVLRAEPEKPSRLSSVDLSSSGFGWARTDLHGIAVFDWLPSNAVGRVQIAVAQGRYSIPSLSEANFHDGSTVTTIPSIPNVPLRGRVVSPDGKPAAGILVKASGAYDNLRFEVVGAGGLACTAADGTYEILVPAGHSYMVGVDDRNWAAKSCTGIVIDDAPVVVPDLRLIVGSVIRGRVRLDPEGRPMSGQTILLNEYGAQVQIDAGEGRTRARESLTRKMAADRDGRFAFRVAPGPYTVSVMQGTQVDRFERTVADGETIDVDVHLVGGGIHLKGQVFDRSRESATSVSGAIVRSLQGDGPWEAETLADSQGRFEMEGPELRIIRAGGSVLYARTPDGSRAGFATLKPDQIDISIDLHEAARISGQVVDSDGRPVASRGVVLRMARGAVQSPILRFEGSLQFETSTDGQGRYEFTGLPPQTHGNVSLETPDDQPETDGVSSRPFQIDGPAPLSLPSLIVSAPTRHPDAGDLGGPSARPRTPTVNSIAMSRPVPIPAGPSRAEVEALIRAIGRDPVTPKLVDRIIARFHPRLRPPPFDRVRQLATDPEFVRHVDERTREVLRKPLDTIMLLRCAAAYRIGYDDGRMKADLLTWDDRDRAARPTIRGTVKENDTNRPVPDARVSIDIPDFTDEGFVLTDEQGRFTLAVPPRASWYVGSMELRDDLKHITLWVEADDRASTLRFVPLEVVARNEEQTILLKPEAPFFGAVVDTSGRPVSRAVAEMYATRRASMTGGPIPDDLVDATYSTFAVLTDAQGRFSFVGLPAPDPKNSTALAVTHPEFQVIDWLDLGVASVPGTSPQITLEPGCTVSGVVVNRRGDPVSAAFVRIPDREGPEVGLTSLTDRGGRFQFHNVEPGRRIVVAQSERLAAAWTMVVADPRRPVQNQLVVQPGDSLAGKVVDSNGKPLAGASVGCSLLIPSDGVAGGELDLGISALTAKDGSFRLAPVPPSELLLRAFGDTHGTVGELRVTDIQKEVVITLKKSEPFKPR